MTRLEAQDFVDLGRTFKILRDHGITEDSQRFDPASAYGKSIPWSELLEWPRVVILSEAGSGKTKEIREAARRLRYEGKAAFFLRLENLNTDIEDALEEGSFEEFEAWRRTGECGWLFLDSVDEARLQSPKDFERAIRAVKRHLADAGPRVRIVLTSRASEWRPVSDLSLCEAHIPCPPPSSQEDGVTSDNSGKPVPSSTAGGKYQFVTLEDLSREQVTIFAKAHGLEDLNGFLNALDLVGEAMYHSRPADLLELFAQWHSQKRFGSRLDMMRESVKMRLRERDQDRDRILRLDWNRAHQAAKTLAAAVTLCRCQEILVPDSVKHRNCLDIEELLPEWDGKDRAALLIRPIFDQETYGTVRFHHRSAREYLTAEWFAHLLSKGGSRRNVEALFFREQYCQAIVAPALRPILPWLVHMDERICRLVQERAPELFLEGGDPASLSAAIRRDALERICERIAQGLCNKWPGTAAYLARFAQEDLTESVRSAFVRHAGCDPVLEFLLQLVWRGKLSGVWGEVDKIVRGETMSPDVGRWGWIAANAIGKEGQLHELREWYLESISTVDRETLSILVEGLPPDMDESAWIGRALERCEASKAHSYDKLGHELTDYVERLREEHLPALLLAFDRLLGTETLPTEFGDLPGRHLWLLGPACEAVARLIRVRHPEALGRAAMSTLLRHETAKYMGSEITELKQELRNLIAEWPQLNELLFWECIGQARRLMKPSEQLTSWLQVAYEALFQPGSISFSRMLEAIAAKETPDDRAVALSLAFWLYHNAGRSEEWLEQLRNATSPSQELTTLLEQYLAPPEPDAEQAWKQEAMLWQKEQKEREAKERRDRDEYFGALRTNLETHRKANSDNPGALTSEVINLYQVCPMGQSSHTSYSFADWRALEPEFGNDVARFYRDAAVSLWRHHVPQIRSEGAEPNQTTYSVIIGLSGLAIESKEDPDWLTSLIPEDAVRACRYASFELNGFPAWYPGLFERFPDVVGNFLMQEIRYELSQETASSSLNHIIDRLTWSGQWAWDWLAPRLHELLETCEPKRQGSLDSLLKILRESNLESETIAELCDRKCQEIPGTSEMAASWHAAWVGVSPGKAINAFKKRIQEAGDPSHQTEFVMHCITRITGNRRASAIIARDAFEEARHLKELYLLAHRYVRIADDIDRADCGVYSPGLRDYAQDARHAILGRLEKLPGKDAYNALREIAEEAPLPHMREWIRKSALSKAEQEGDIPLWSSANVREFYTHLERTPETHKDLAEFAKLRLLDLKEDWENGDQSIASVLLNQKETEVRKFIGNTLRQQSRSRYHVVPEEELADGKRPDLRMNGTHFDEPVPIELKLANRWTGNQLIERLENQLCGDYLRDRRSSRGIFLLVNQDTGRHWEIDGQRLGFDALIPALQRHWESIQDRYPDINAIDVIGIDLTARNR